MDHYDRLRLGLPLYVETAGGGGWSTSGHAMSAFASCARWCDVPVEVVLRAASTGKLGRLIEARGGRRTPARRDLRDLLAKRDIVYRRSVVGQKAVPSWL